MSLLVESIKLKDGKLFNPEYHQKRMNCALAELFPEADSIDLQTVISIPDESNTGLFKVRVLYGPELEKVEFEPYQFRTIQSLKIVYHETIDYHLKYTNRQILQQLFASRGECDDIIIIKNGLVTDAFAANILFFDGQKWITPNSPLLKGTQRQLLLDQGIISEQEISEEDIPAFQKVGLVNAMMSFDEMPVIPVEKICRF
jgi:4-amino-4-deoxychorismate lyase